MARAFIWESCKGSPHNVFSDERNGKNNFQCLYNLTIQLEVVSKC